MHLSRLPVIVTTLHSLTYLITKGKIKTASHVLWRPKIKLNEDFTGVLFKLGSSCLIASHSLGMMNEMDPINVAAVDKFINGFAKKDFVDGEEVTVEKTDISSLLFSSHSVSVIRYWRALVKIVIGFCKSFFYYSKKKEDMSIFFNLETRENHYSDAMDDECDEDYQSDSNDGISTSSGSEDGDFDVLDQELFFLAKDLNSEAKQITANPNSKFSIFNTLNYLNFMESLQKENTVLTRSQRKLKKLEINNYFINSNFSDMHTAAGERKELLKLTLNRRKRVTDEIRNAINENYSKESSFSCRVCVVCHCEKRTIVLRPCGCLCLCDDCREALAIRRFNDCPCCRRKVRGFSKIYEP
ncbi:hypothetical protein HK099_000053 [Clydaea vesicula]|uniref:RING-type domain-containing protein n=1 Tax=Clydaea vesicula TaxID=447962 RepID=A0AAD5U7S6_9FUNG|nr:hypothetical protein HK099_000053 [Clydaea vesicula]